MEMVLYTRAACYRSSQRKSDLTDLLERTVWRSVVMSTPMPAQLEGGRLYSLRLFEGDVRLPQIHFLKADNEEHAVSLASSMMPWLTRQIWDGRRLVRVLPPTS